MLNKCLSGKYNIATYHRAFLYVTFLNRMTFSSCMEYTSWFIPLNNFIKTLNELKKCRKKNCFRRLNAPIRTNIHLSTPNLVEEYFFLTIHLIHERHLPFINLSSLFSSTFKKILSLNRRNIFSTTLNTSFHNS